MIHTLHTRPRLWHAHHTCSQLLLRLHGSLLSMYSQGADKHNALICQPAGSYACACACVCVCVCVCVRSLWNDMWFATKGRVPRNRRGTLAAYAVFQSKHLIRPEAAVAFMHHRAELLPNKTEVRPTHSLEPCTVSTPPMGLPELYHAAC